MAEFSITRFRDADVGGNLPQLGKLMHDCVHAGASIGYILPFSQEDGEYFWTRKIMPRLNDGGLILFVATSGDRIAGAVQLDHDTPPKQPHRAEVRKLLVHPDFRRMGLARRLMGRIETEAGILKRSLLTLDTRTGDHAEPLYTSLGYRTTGIIPFYCLDPSEDRLDSTTIMYKRL